MLRRHQRGTFVGAVIAASGLLALSGAAVAAAAPIATTQDLECVYLVGDEILVDDPADADPITSTSTDIPVTLDYTSPADPEEALAVSVEFGAGITNATDITFDELSVAAYLVLATTADGVIVGAGATDDDLLFPTSTGSVAPGDKLPALPTGNVEVGVGPLAAGRTIYLQPVALFLNGDPDVEVPPANAAVGQCQVVGAEDVLARTQDFPVTFTGEQLPIPTPGDQQVDITTEGPVSPGDEIDIELSGYQPGSIVILQECQVDADPCPDLAIEELSADRQAAAVRRSGARLLGLDRAATEPNIAFIDLDGTGSATLEIAEPNDSGCGPTSPCEVVAQDVIEPEFVGRAAITYADDAAQTPTPGPPGATPTGDVAFSPLPETGAGSAPLALAGTVLLGLGLALVLRSRRPLTHDH